jgi:hypothetical protein
MEKVLAAVFLVIFSGAILGGIWAFGSMKCSWSWSGAYETKYDLGGCKVKVGEKWLPEKVVREVQ